jgi:hypothetical protein
VFRRWHRHRRAVSARSGDAQHPPPEAEGEGGLIQHVLRMGGGGGRRAAIVPRSGEEEGGGGRAATIVEEEAAGPGVTVPRDYVAHQLKF